jgi:hypothetical protein
MGEYEAKAQDSKGQWDNVQPVHIVSVGEGVVLGGGGGGGGAPRQFARVGYGSYDPVTVIVFEPLQVEADIGGLTEDGKIAIPDGVTWARCGIGAQVFMAENADAVAHTILLRVFEADVPTLDGAHNKMVLNTTAVYMHGSILYHQGPPFAPTPGMNYYVYVGSATPVMVSLSVDTEILA